LLIRKDFSFKQITTRIAYKKGFLSFLKKEPLF